MSEAVQVKKVLPTRASPGCSLLLKGFGFLAGGIVNCNRDQAREEKALPPTLAPITKPQMD